MGAQPKLLAGKIVVFTGKLSMTRAEATAMAVRSGATVVSSVTKDTNVVVVGADSGSKLDKAVAKGIEVWSEADFIRKMTVEEHQERLVENKGRVIEATGKNKFQFSLAWDALVDLDIHCQTPTGKVYFGCREVDGVTLDVDRIPRWEDQSGWQTRPVENIVAEKLTPGDYEVTVVWFSSGLKAHRGAVPFTVHYRVGEVENVFRGSLAKVGAIATILKFKVDASRNLIVNEAPAPAAGKKAAAKPKKDSDKTAAKKAPAKKPAAKKTAAKKPAPRITVAKKKPSSKRTAPAKKTKPATKKAAVKKTAAKKDAKKARPAAAKTTKAKTARK